MRRTCRIGIRFGKENEMDKSIEWHLEHKRLGFYDPIAELYEELQAKAQLSEEDATFNAENVELNTTQDVQSVGSVGDYISRQAAIEALDRAVCHYCVCPCDKPYSKECNAVDNYSAGIRVIEELPTADVVEVVKCKQCKHYDTHNHKCWYWNHGIRKDDYCSKAERRTDG